MPTQIAASAVPVLFSSVGTFHDPLTEVTEPLAPVTAYPLQLVLNQLLLLEPIKAIPGAIIGLVKANAELKAAKSMSEPTRNEDNVAENFTRLHLCLSNL
jgi:hypothetical protein